MTRIARETWAHRPTGKLYAVLTEDGRIKRSFGPFDPSDAEEVDIHGAYLSVVAEVADLADQRRWLEENRAEVDVVRADAVSDRYVGFVRHVQAGGDVWALVRDGDWALVELDGREVVAVWADEQAAASAAFGNLSGHEPGAISATDWREAWLPGLANDERAVAVEPSSTDAGDVVDPMLLALDLDSM